MKKCFLFFLLIFFAENIFGQNLVSKVAGTYQWCPFECETIKINPDFTFDYLIDGDLFSNERTSGVWQFTGENKIHLKSPPAKLINNVVEKQTANSDRILIQAVDGAGGIFSGIKIKAIYTTGEKDFITDENGICEIPKTDEIEVDWTRLSEKYRIKDRSTNELNIEFLTYFPPYLDDSFVFNENFLFKFVDNEISDLGFKRLKRKVSDKLFPKKINAK